MSDKDKLIQILSGENVKGDIENNLDTLLLIIPEIKNMIGFKHNHPHHNLDVWQHTLKVIENLSTDDVELNMAGLLHDIGKPFSYQDEEVRHFHGHPEVSYEMSKTILRRLEFDEDFIKRVTYLVRTHDTIIDTDNLDNSYDLVNKRLQLQYADAKAHHPDKIKKRIDFLNEIREKLKRPLLVQER